MPALAAGVVAVCTTWTWGLLASRPRAVGILTVAAETALAPEQSILVVRAWGALAGVRVQLAPVVGTAQAGGAAAPFVDGIARVPLGSGADTLAIAASLGSAPVTMRIPLTREASAGRPSMRWSPWTDELLTGLAADRAMPAFYPLDGRISSRLRSDVLVCGATAGEPLKLEALEPLVAGQMLDDGRTVRTDRTGLQVRLEPVVEPLDRLAVTVVAADPGRVGVDVRVDDVLVAAQNLEIQGEATAQIDLPAPMRDGSLVTVSAAGVLPAAAGTTRVALVRDPQVQPAAAAVHWAKLAGAPQMPPEPLLLKLEAEPDPRAVGAVLQRLGVKPARAGVVSPPPEDQRAEQVRAQRAEGGLRRGVFRGAAALLALALVLTSLLTGRRPRDPRPEEDRTDPGWRPAGGLGVIARVLLAGASLAVLVGLDAALGIFGG